jgi:uncharacterized membrane protein
MHLAQGIVAIALTAVFVGMGVLHFVPSIGRGMAAMIPPRMRFVSARYLVWFTGLCEIAGGIGLQIPALRVASAIALIVFLIAVFPANAFAAQHPEKFGRAAIPFWPRLAGQGALIALLLFVVLPITE